MPTYVYECEECGTDRFERVVPISQRDEQFCDKCKFAYRRLVTFTGLTWAPTAGGMR